MVLPRLAAPLAPGGRFHPCRSSSIACLVSTSTSPTVSLINWCSSRQVSAASGRSRTLFWNGGVHLPLGCSSLRFPASIRVEGGGSGAGPFCSLRTQLMVHIDNGSLPCVNQQSNGVRNCLLPAGGVVAHHSLRKTSRNKDKNSISP